MSNNTTELGKAKRTLFLLLNEHLKFVGNNLVTYKDGWSDQEIRKEVQLQHPDVDMTLNIVTGTRIRSWGVLFKEPKKTDAERIEELEATVQQLNKTVDSLLAELNRKSKDTVADSEPIESGSIDNLFN